MLIVLRTDAINQLAGLQNVLRTQHLLRLFVLAVSTEDFPGDCFAALFCVSTRRGFHLQQHASLIISLVFRAGVSRESPASKNRFIEKISLAGGYCRHGVRRFHNYPSHALSFARRVSQSIPAFSTGPEVRGRGIQVSSPGMSIAHLKITAGGEQKLN